MLQIRLRLIPLVAGVVTTGLTFLPLTLDAGPRVETPSPATPFGANDAAGKRLIVGGTSIYDNAAAATRGATRSRAAFPRR